MKVKKRIQKLGGAILLILVIGVPQAGCDLTGAVIGSVVGTTVFTGLSPSHSLEQIYYLGVFDPQEQISPSIYRVTVRGQASALSQMNFASGWMPAQLVDSLNTNIGIDRETGQITLAKGEEDHLADIETGRRMVLFGPEGFREAPRNHRLAIVMGSSPEKYFQAIDEALGKVAEVRHEQLHGKVRDQLVQTLIALTNEEKRLKDLEVDVKLLGIETEGG